MNQKLPLLAALLGLQLLVVALLLLRGSDAAPVEALLSFSASDIQTVTIDDRTDSVTLERADEGWQVLGYPADAKKADELIAKFADLKAPWPVSNTAESAERFEVLDSNYQRQLKFSGAAGELGHIRLGTSPGYQRVHAQVGTSDEVFAVPFSNFQAPVGVDDWLDKSVLAVASIEQVARPGQWTLASAEAGWTLNGEPAAADKAASYVDRLVTLRVLGLAEEDQQYVAKGEIEVISQGKRLKFSLAHDEAADEYVVSRDGVAGQFRLATYIALQLLVDADEFALEDAAAEEEAGSPPSTVDPA